MIITAHTINVEKLLELAHSLLHRYIVRRPFQFFPGWICDHMILPWGPRNLGCIPSFAKADGLSKYQEMWDHLAPEP